MATDKQLKKAAIELNDMMGLTPEINVKGSAEELAKGIKAAMKHITPDDEFSEATQEVLDEISAPAKKAAPALTAKKKAAPVVVEEEDDEDEEDVEDDEAEDDEEEEEIPAPKAKKKAAPAPEPVAKKKKAPVVVEDDEDEDDEEEEVAPVKKGKAAPVAEKKVAKKGFPGKVSADSAESPTYVVRYATCKNPKITDQELMNLQLKKGGKLAMVSVIARKKEMLSAIAILKALGKL